MTPLSSAHMEADMKECMPHIAVVYFLVFEATNTWSSSLHQIFAHVLPCIYTTGKHTMYHKQAQQNRQAQATRQPSGHMCAYTPCLTHYLVR